MIGKIIYNKSRVYYFYKKKCVQKRITANEAKYIKKKYKIHRVS